MRYAPHRLKKSHIRHTPQLAHSQHTQTESTQCDVGWMAVCVFVCGGYLCACGWLACGVNENDLQKCILLISSDCIES